MTRLDYRFVSIILAVEFLDQVLDAIVYAEKGDWFLMICAFIYMPYVAYLTRELWKVKP